MMSQLKRNTENHELIHFQVMKLELNKDTSVGKESSCNAGDLGSIPGLGRLTEVGNGSPLQYSCLGNPMDRGAWRIQSMESQSQTRLRD